MKKVFLIALMFVFFSTALMADGGGNTTGCNGGMCKPKVENSTK